MCIVLCLMHTVTCWAAGEYISVSSQKDAEEADIEKERLEQLKGPEARQREFEELVSSLLPALRVAVVCVCSLLR